MIKYECNIKLKEKNERKPKLMLVTCILLSRCGHLLLIKKLFGCKYFPVVAGLLKGCVITRLFFSLELAQAEVCSFGEPTLFYRSKTKPERYPRPLQ